MPKCTKIPLAVLLRPDPLEELMRSQTLYPQGHFNNHTKYFTVIIHNASLIMVDWSTA